MQTTLFRAVNYSTVLPPRGTQRWSGWKRLARVVLIAAGLRESVKNQAGVPCAAWRKHVRNAVQQKNASSIFLRGVRGVLRTIARLCGALVVEFRYV